jgi:hypothetical protein
VERVKYHFSDMAVLHVAVPPLGSSINPMTGRQPRSLSFLGIFFGLTCSQGKWPLADQLSTALSSVWPQVLRLSRGPCTLKSPRQSVSVFQVPLPCPPSSLFSKTLNISEERALCAAALGESGVSFACVFWEVDYSSPAHQTSL